MLSWHAITVILVKCLVSYYKRADIKCCCVMYKNAIVLKLYEGIHLQRLRGLKLKYEHCLQRFLIRYLQILMHAI